MWELVRKSMLAGVGFTVMGKEKVEAMIDQLVQQTDVSEEEGKKFLNEMKEAADGARQDMENKIKDAIQERLEKLEVATKNDVNALAARVEALEKKLESGGN